MAEPAPAPPKPPPPPPPPPTEAAAAEGAPGVAEIVPAVPAPAAAKPSDDSVPGADEGAQKKPADDGARAAADVIAEETAKANGRHETSVPDKSFESLNMFERFKRAPPVKDPTGNVMELGKLVPNALLFGKSTLKTKDGITSVTTFSAFCARPKHYNSQEPLERLIFSEARLRLAVHGYGVGGDAREVIFGCLHERADGTVAAVCHDVLDDKIDEHLLWRVVGAEVLAPPPDDSSILPSYRTNLMAHMTKKMEGMPSRGDSQRSKEAGEAGGERHELEGAARDAVLVHRREQPVLLPGGHRLIDKGHPWRSRVLLA